MTLAPLIPAWGVVLTALCLASLTVIFYRHHLPLMLLRLTALALLVYALANPVRQEPLRDPTAPGELVVIVDSSGSMAQAAADGAADSRYQRAQTAATALIAQLSERWLVRELALDDRLRGAPPTQPGGDTDLGGLLGLDAFQAAAAILISDGADWQDGHGRLAGRLMTPVHCLGVGAHGTNTNAAVLLSSPSPTAFPGQELPLRLGISASDSLVGQPARLHLEEVHADGRIVALRSQDLFLSRDLQLSLPVAVGEELGSRLWRARLELDAQEASKDDNMSHLSVQVIDRAIQVAVIEGQPYWDTTFAVRALRQDRQFTLTTWYGLGERNYSAGPLADEVQRVFAGEVDVVILGSQIQGMLDDGQVAGLLAFVEGGGGIIFLGDGPRPEALAALAPIRHAAGSAQSVVPVATPTGRRLDLLPSGESLAAVKVAPLGELRPHSQVYLGSREQPLLAHRRQGLGWVMSVNAEGIWRWRLGRNDDPGSRFWRQLIKSSTRDVGGHLRPSRLQYRRGDQAELWLAGVEPGSLGAVSVTSPSGASRAVAVDRGRVAFSLSEIGTWRVDALGESVQLVVNEQLGEQVLTARDDQVLARIGSVTGGSARDLSRADELVAELVAARRLSTSRRMIEIPLITQPWWLLALTLLLTCEWTLRRRRYGVV